ncbi:MAG TPA: hypothetical protein PKA33_15975 [Amaricoccus sp.]|uniref:hypothetical protein n=1 Tax=Amaricoccus sp. TaxID=1872485 RepID=UPI002C2CBD6F|nr:hypothetical protein [Amaricoccus sp.]HMQ92500.1 hypothetical protein [Amaricoccus sp.]HMR53851.1 hypothetical protein [Amaricoccus sp.]HMR58968.1 hypothetical protein [Amaricoccus sp.]HMU00846.1 hypothetical protein [Amaricoccus sp.]
MENWFLGHFEDPANRVSYNSREGGYIWVPDLGPHDANDQIQVEFSDVASLELMTEAVDAVQADGVIDWASSDYFRDNEGLPYDLPMSFKGRPAAGTAPIFSSAVGAHPIGWTGAIVEPGVVEPGIFEDEPQVSEEIARRAMLDRLDRLEQMIAPLVAQVGMMGHNGPPGPIEDPYIPDRDLRPEDPPLNARDIFVVNIAIQEVRAQARAAEPDQEIVEKSQGVLARAAKQIGRWCMMFADEAVKSAGSATGKAAALLAAGTIGWQQLGPVVESAAASIAAWIQTIPIPW